MFSSDDDMDIDDEQLSRFLTQSRDKARLASGIRSVEPISTPATATGTATAASNATGNATGGATGSSELQKQIQERAGENAILRDQLSSQAARHTHELKEVLDAQKRSRETQKSELAQMRAELNALRWEKQFLVNEVRSKSMSASRAKVPGLPTPQTPSQSPAASIGGARRPASLAIADGFSKKAKLAHSTSSEIQMHAQTMPVNIFLCHYMPGSKVPSLQMLDNIQHPTKAPLSMASSLLVAPEKARFKELLELVTLVQTEKKSLEPLPVLLALIYSELQHGTEPTQAEISELVKLACELLEQFEPLTDLEHIQLEILFAKEDAFLLTSLLYLLDILQCVSALREIPDNFADQLVATRVPGIIEKGLGVLNNGKDVRENAVVESVLMNENIQPRLEMLFAGLNDSSPIHVTALQSYSSEFLDLGVRKDDLPPWRATVEAASCGMRAAAINLLTRSAPTKTIVTRVVDILSTEVDRVLTAPRRDLISACVRYLWLASDRTLFLNNQKNQDEMIVSCARISFSKQYSSELVGWAQDLLHHCGNPEEIDAIADEML